MLVLLVEDPVEAVDVTVGMVFDTLVAPVGMAAAAAVFRSGGEGLEASIACTQQTTKRTIATNAACVCHVNLKSLLSTSAHHCWQKARVG